MMNNLMIKGHFKITKKVENLLIYIAEAGYSSINEMNLFITSKGHVYSVLSGLLEMGIISEIRTGISPHKVYCLSGTGYAYLEGKGLLKSISRFQPSDFRVTTCNHHLTALGSRIMFEKILSVKNWLTEKRLNFSRTEDGIEGRRIEKRVTDAEFDLDNIHVGVEVELTLKAPEILKRNFENLNNRLRRNNLSNVFWITKSENIRAAVQRICGLKEEPNLIELSDVNASHLFIDYSDLIGKQDQCLVTNLSGKLKRLGELSC